jgi:hypothetical protein
MIDPNFEKLIALSDAAELFPPRRRGRKPHVSCIYRYTTTGYRGIVLESVQAAGTRATSREAVTRFLARITATTQLRITTAQADSRVQQASSDDVDEQLDSAGL